MDARTRLGAAALGLAGLVGAACSGDDPAAGATTTAGAGAEVVDAFVAAYERSRTASFVIGQTFSRSAGDRGELAYGVRVAQRPPDDRLTVGGGTAAGKVDGLVVRCVTEPSGTSECFDGGAAAADAPVVAAEVEDLRRLVTGDPAPYLVAVDADGCFELTLQVRFPSAPYGLEAMFCFDDASGAPTRVRVDHGEDIVDDTVTDRIRTDVTDADFRVGDLGTLPVPQTGD
ncbi:MAG: hypothetical protein H0W25_14535 [Acidimicrobiia bacterium]|nr:hypothetical protein [Acidimicrobiia bacterium]